MAIKRTLTWEISEDGLSIAPNNPQDGGVQGEHNATLAVFRVAEGSAWADPDYAVYIECEDNAGNIDITEQLTVKEGTVSYLLPLAWTQYGGLATLRLVAEQMAVDGDIVRSPDAMVRFTGRQNASKKVDGLLKTHLAPVLAAVPAVEAAAHTAENAKNEAVKGRDDAIYASSSAKTSLDGARVFAANAEAAAQRAEAAADSGERVTIADDGKGNVAFTTVVAPDEPEEPVEPEEPEIIMKTETAESTADEYGNHFLTLSADKLPNAEEGKVLTVTTEADKVLCYNCINIFPEKTFTWLYDTAIASAKRPYSVELPFEYPAGKYRVSAAFTNDSASDNNGLIQALDKDGTSVGGSISLKDNDGARTGYSFTATKPIKSFKFFTASNSGTSSDVTATYADMCLLYTSESAGTDPTINEYKGDFDGVVYDVADGVPFADGVTMFAEGGVPFSVSHEYEYVPEPEPDTPDESTDPDTTSGGTLYTFKVDGREYNSFYDHQARRNIESIGTTVGNMRNDIDALQELVEQVGGTGEATTDTTAGVLPDYLIEEADRVSNSVWLGHYADTEEGRNIELNFESDLSFLVFADPHSFEEYKYRKYAKLMENGGIDFMLGLGDYNAYHSGYPLKADIIGDMHKVLSASGKGANCLYVAGNHDVFVSNTNNSRADYGITLDKTLTKKELHKLLCGHLNGVAHFNEADPYACYYYVDYTAAKIRVIVLNASEQWDENGNVMASTGYSSTIAFSQRQMDWLTGTALDFTETGWSVMVAIHTTRIVSDNTVLYKLLKAVKNGTTCNYSDDWITIDADFTDKGADVIGIFYGHGHHDSTETIETIKSLQIRSDNAHIDDVYIAPVNGVTPNASYCITSQKGHKYGYTITDDNKTDYSAVKYVQYNEYHANRTAAQLTDNNYVEVWLLDANMLPIKFWSQHWTHGLYTEGMPEIATGWTRRRREGTASMESCAIVNINKDARTITVVPYGLCDARVIEY